MLLLGYRKTADLLHSSAGAVSSPHLWPDGTPHLMIFLVFAGSDVYPLQEGRKKHLSWELVLQTSHSALLPQYFCRADTHSSFLCTEMLKPSASLLHWLRERAGAALGSRVIHQGRLILPLPFAFWKLVCIFLTLWVCKREKMSRHPPFGWQWVSWHYPIGQMGEDSQGKREPAIKRGLQSSVWVSITSSWSTLRWSPGQGHCRKDNVMWLDTENGCFGSRLTFAF